MPLSVLGADEQPLVFGGGQSPLFLYGGQSLSFQSVLDGEQSLSFEDTFAGQSPLPFEDEVYGEQWSSFCSVVENEGSEQQPASEDDVGAASDFDASTSSACPSSDSASWSDVFSTFREPVFEKTWLVPTNELERVEARQAQGPERPDWRTENLKKLIKRSFEYLAGRSSSVQLERGLYYWKLLYRIRRRQPSDPLVKELRQRMRATTAEQKMRVKKEIMIAICIATNDELLTRYLQVAVLSISIVVECISVSQVEDAVYLHTVLRRILFHPELVNKHRRLDIQTIVDDDEKKDELREKEAPEQKWSNPFTGRQISASGKLARRIQGSQVVHIKHQDGGKADVYELTFRLEDGFPPKTFTEAEIQGSKVEQWHEKLVGYQTARAKEQQEQQQKEQQEKKEGKAQEQNDQEDQQEVHQDQRESKELVDLSCDVDEGRVQADDHDIPSSDGGDGEDDDKEDSGADGRVQGECARLKEQGDEVVQQLNAVIKELNQATGGCRVLAGELTRPYINGGPSDAVGATRLHKEDLRASNAVLTAMLSKYTSELAVVRSSSLSSSSSAAPVSFGPRPRLHILPSDEQRERHPLIKYYAQQKPVAASGFVTDEPPSFFMEVLNYHLVLDDQVQHAYCLTSLAVTKALQDPEHVLRALDDIHANSARYLLFPRYSVHAHWWLDVYDTLRDILYRYDSYRRANMTDDQLEALLARLNGQAPTVMLVDDVPQQLDDISSGDHMICFAMVVTQSGWCSKNPTLSRVLAGVTHRQKWLDWMQSDEWERHRPQPDLKPAVEEQELIDTEKQLELEMKETADLKRQHGSPSTPPLSTSVSSPTPRSFASVSSSSTPTTEPSIDVSMSLCSPGSITSAITTSSSQIVLPGEKLPDQSSSSITTTVHKRPREASEEQKSQPVKRTSRLGTVRSTKEMLSRPGFFLVPGSEVDEAHKTLLDSYASCLWTLCTIQEALPFVDPVNHTDPHGADYHPGYLEKVPNPICLRDVEERIRSGSYRRANDVLDDIDRVWSSARLYYSKEDPRYHASLQVRPKYYELFGNRARYRAVFARKPAAFDDVESFLLLSHLESEAVV